MPDRPYVVSRWGEVVSPDTRTLLFRVSDFDGLSTGLYPTYGGRLSIMSYQWGEKCLLRPYFPYRAIGVAAGCSSMMQGEQV